MFSPTWSYARWLLLVIWLWFALERACPSPASSPRSADLLGSVAGCSWAGKKARSDLSSQLPTQIAVVHAQVVQDQEDFAVADHLVPERVW